MKRFLIIITLFVGCVSSQAQETSFWHKVNRLLTKPAVVDSTYIYQPKPCFALGFFTTGQKANFDVDVDYGVDLGDGYSLAGKSCFSLNESLCKKIGLEVSYGNVGLGYGVEVGHKSAVKKRSLGFNILGKSWGFHLNYYKITNPFISKLTIEDNNGEIFYQDEFTPEGHATLQNFTLDGYYVFNNKRFVYPAAFKMCLIQRRTAGSWMLTARYMQGKLYNSPEAAWDSYNLLDCVATMQASIGGGYSVNFVLWHKDPAGSRDEKLRNLTVNLTAMPVLTVFNYLNTTSYEYDTEGNCIDEDNSKVLCNPMPNFIGSTAVSLTMGRLYFSTQFTYNYYYFRSRDAFDASQLDIPYDVDDLNFHGTFRDWTVKGLLIYRF